MSYSFKDRIGGKRVRVVYEANPHAVAMSAGRWVRSQSVGSHMKNHKAKFALPVRSGGEQTGFETWWAAHSAGVSLAAAIANWIQQSSAGGEMLQPDFVVALPMDERVYVARVVRHTIAQEHMLEKEKARELIDGHIQAGELVYAWRSGTSEKPADTESAIGELVPLEKAPFDLTEFSFRPAWLAFALTGLLHPGHLVASLALVAISAAGLYSGTAVEYLAQGPLRGVLGMFFEVEDVEDIDVEMTVITPSVPHSVPDHLRYLAGRIVEAESLYADGIRRLSYNGRTVTLEGRSGGRYPHLARSFAERMNAEWRLSNKGWTIALPGTRTRGERPPDLDYEAMFEAMSGLPVPFSFTSGPTRVAGVRNRSDNTVTRPMHKSQYSAEVGRTAVGNLVELSDAMAGLPGDLKEAQCSFGEWSLGGCSLVVEVHSL